MIVVKMCMWPQGDESREVEFGRVKIANRVTTTQATGGDKGDYSVTLFGGVYGREDLYNKVWRRGEVLGFDRVKRGGWDLLCSALIQCLGGRR